MDRFLFRHVDRNGDSIEMNITAVTITEVLEFFENFLKGCGYIFEGALQIVEHEELVPSIAQPNDDEPPKFI